MLVFAAWYTTTVQHVERFRLVRTHTRTLVRARAHTHTLVQNFAQAQTFFSRLVIILSGVGEEGRVKEAPPALSFLKLVEM